MELLQKLNDYGATDPKQNTKIEKINYALLLNGIIPIFLRSIKDGENNLDKYKEYIRLQQFHKIEEIIKKIKDEVN